MTGAEVLVRELQARGVPFMAVLCGNGLDPLLAAAAQAGLRLVDTRNEQAASYIADAYARLTGRVGVCAVSSGIAHINALAGVLNAHYDGAPVLLITGASPSASLGRSAFQDLDQVAVARPICKRAELVSHPERIPQAVHEAFAVATSGRPGPVHLTIPVDVLKATLDQAQLRVPFSTRGETGQPAAGDANLVRDAAAMLAQAQRPVIVAGSQLFYARAGKALTRFARLTHIPVVTPIWDRGVMDQPLEEFMGVVGAASGEPEILTRADVILLAGARVDYRIRYLDSPPLAKGVHILRIDVDPEELRQGTEPDIAILADGQTAFEQLAEAWQSGDHTGHHHWLREARQICQRFYARWAVLPEPRDKRISGAHIVQALRQVLAEETLFLVDGGNIGQWAHMALCHDRYPGHWLTCGASGVVGWGVPGAMAARLTFPDRPVVLLSGDGALGFGIAEFESSSRQGIPFVVVVADDRAWGIVVSGQSRAYGSAIASELSAVDYVRVAEGLGGQGQRIEKPEQIVPAIQDGLEARKPTLIHVPIIAGGPADEPFCRDP